MAINAAIVSQRDAYGAAKYTVSGAHAKSKKLALITLQETDGESEYHIRLNGRLIAICLNGRTDIDYKEAYFVIENLSLKAADVLSVVSKSATNGKIPEGDGTAYARGRWRGIALL